jgi:hypothetical protein
MFIPLKNDILQITAASIVNGLGSGGTLFATKMLALAVSKTKGYDDKQKTNIEKDILKFVEEWMPKAEVVETEEKNGGADNV